MKGWKLVSCALMLIVFAVLALSARAPVSHFLPTMTVLVLFVAFAAHESVELFDDGVFSEAPFASLANLSLNPIKDSLQRLVKVIHRSAANGGGNEPTVTLSEEFFSLQCNEAEDDSGGAAAVSFCDGKRVSIDRLQAYVNDVAKIAEMFQFMASNDVPIPHL
jgi:hypothetical protein